MCLIACDISAVESCGHSLIKPWVCVVRNVDNQTRPWFTEVIHRFSRELATTTVFESV